MIASDPSSALTERANFLGPKSEAEMNNRPDQGQNGHETDEHLDIRFTARGDAALDELAAALTADLTGGLVGDSTSAADLDPADIAAVLQRVMNADVDDLAAAVTAADPSADLHDAERLLDDPQLDLGQPKPDDVDEVATRRLARVPYPPPPQRPDAASGR